MDCLFKVRNGKAQITDQVRNIWLFNYMIEQYGEQTASKIFTVIHFMVDLTLENPFSNLSEVGKLEKIISAVAPETEIDVDWNSYEMIDAIELAREIYETSSYRYYLAKKDVRDRAIHTIRYTHLDASKEYGNADQISKWDKYIQEAEKTTRAAYKAFLEEKGAIQVRGKGQQSSDSIADKEKELE